MQLRDLLDHIATQPDIEETIWSDSQQRVRWWPLLPVQDLSHRLGLTTLGHWVIETRMGLYELQTLTSFVRILPLLEQPYTQVVQHITQRSPSEGYGDGLVMHFPFAEIVRAGLVQGSPYWAALALEWFDMLPPTQQQALISALEAVVKASWASQQVRHKARCRLKQL